jgi:hypothetical protein
MDVDRSAITRTKQRAQRIAARIAALLPALAGRSGILASGFPFAVGALSGTRESCHCSEVPGSTPVAGFS